MPFALGASGFDSRHRLKKGILSMTIVGDVAAAVGTHTLQQYQAKPGKSWKPGKDFAFRWGHHQVRVSGDDGVDVALHIETKSENGQYLCANGPFFSIRLPEARAPCARRVTPVGCQPASR